MGNPPSSRVLYHGYFHFHSSSTPPPPLLVLASHRNPFGFPLLKEINQNSYALLRYCSQIYATQAEMRLGKKGLKNIASTELRQQRINYVKKIFHL